MTALGYAITDLLSYEPHAASPTIEAPRTGIGLHFVDLAFDGEVVSGDLLVTYCFPRSDFEAFQRLMWAIKIVAEDVGGRRGALLSLKDARKKFPPHAGPNFRAPDHRAPLSHRATSETRFKTQWVTMPLEIEVLAADFDESLFLTAVLHEHSSNTLAFDLRNKVVSSYRDGQRQSASLLAEPTREDSEIEPSAGGSREGSSDGPSDGPSEGLSHSSSDSSPSSPDGPSSGTWDRSMDSVRLSTGETSVRSGQPIPMVAALSLGPRTLALGGAESWQRSLFATILRVDSQAGAVMNILEDRVALASDLKPTSNDGASAVRGLVDFDLAGLLGRAPSPGEYSVQVSARWLRSKVVRILVS